MTAIFNIDAYYTKVLGNNVGLVVAIMFLIFTLQSWKHENGRVSFYASRINI